MADRQKAEEIALSRYKVVAPIIAVMEEKADALGLNKVKASVF